MVWVYIYIYMWSGRQRRLTHLREELFNPVRDMLPPDLYGALFGNAPFARRGGFRGTTARLESWCQALALGVSSAKLPPLAVATTLRAICVPVATAVDFSPAAASPGSSPGGSAASLSPAEAQEAESWDHVTTRLQRPERAPVQLEEAFPSLPPSPRTGGSQSNTEDCEL